MKIVIGADSAGKPLLDVIAQHLAAKGLDVTDLSPASGSTPEFYADTAERVGLAVAAHDYVGPELAKAVVDTWLAAAVDATGASAGNVAAMDKLDEKYSR